MNNIRSCAAAIALLLAGTAAQADSAAGKALHDKHCTKCHGADIYTRKDRIVRNLEHLNKQVTRCQLSLGVNWFDDDIANVVEYLNANYYKFGQ